MSNAWMSISTSQIADQNLLNQEQGNDVMIFCEIQKANWLILAWHAPSSSNEGVPCQGDAQVVPVDPGKPGRQVGGVPLQTARGSKLPTEALLNVHHRLQLAVKHLPQQRDVGNRQTERVDLRKESIEFR